MAVIAKGGFMSKEKFAEKLRKMMQKKQNKLGDKKTSPKEAESICRKLFDVWKKSNIAESYFVFIPVGSLLNGKILYDSTIYSVKPKAEVVIEEENVSCSNYVKIGTCSDLDSILEKLYQNDFQYEIVEDTLNEEAMYNLEQLPILVKVTW